MFKQLYTTVLNLNLNFKLNCTSNLYSFLKKSIFIRNYTNYLNFYINLFNKLELKTVQTSFFIFNLDTIIPIIPLTLFLWVIVEFCFI